MKKNITQSKNPRKRALRKNQQRELTIGALSKNSILAEDAASASVSEFLPVEGAYEIRCDGKVFTAESGSMAVLPRNPMLLSSQIPRGP
jgi:hypothetical protein